MNGFAIMNDKTSFRAVDGEFADPTDPSKLYPDPDTEYFSTEPLARTVLSQEAALFVARSERDRLLTYATLRINPLQDDVDNDEATPEGVALLRAWKKYRSDVSKTESKEGWPQTPLWPEPPLPLE
ncbi:MAG: tail fiber assembly protein [Pseudomonas piscis]|uniref:tail fiber assembly protein n=1 Tax=Pseudomonas piscis TaxID=2614538 RepID=UPI003D2A4636